MAQIAAPRYVQHVKLRRCTAAVLKPSWRSRKRRHTRTQNYSQSCGKWWWTRTWPTHGQAVPPNNPNHTILLGTIVWMVVLAKYESNVMSDLDDRPTGGLNEN